MSVDKTLRRLGFTGTTRTPDIKKYWKRNFTAIFGTREQLSPFFHIVFTWYCTISSCINSNKMMFGNFFVSGSFNVFVKLPMMTSESYQIWHFQGPRSRDLTTGYTSSWIGAEVWKKYNLISTNFLILFMTYTATCFDKKLANFRPLNEIFNCMKFNGLTIYTQLFKLEVQ